MSTSNNWYLVSMKNQINMGSPYPLPVVTVMNVSKPTAIEEIMKKGKEI